MLDVPLSVILSWPKPNNVNPQTRGSADLVISIIFLSISIPTVCLRLYVRRVVKQSLGWDDIFCAVSLALAIAFAVCILYLNYGLHCAKHIWDLSLDKIDTGFKIAVGAKVLFQLAGTTIRHSLLCFYLRMMGQARIRRFHCSVYTTMILNALMGLIFGVMCAVHCIPVSAYFKFPASAFGSCVNDGALTMTGGALNVLLDFIVVFLPIPVIIRLQTSKQLKVGIVLCLCLGLVASGVAIARTYYTWKTLYDTYDASWWVYPLFIACTVELHIALICSCAPAIRPWIAARMPWTANLLHWLISTARSPNSSTADFNLPDLRGNHSKPSIPEKAAKVSPVYVGATETQVESWSSPFPNNRPGRVQHATEKNAARLSVDQGGHEHYDSDDDMPPELLYHQEIRHQAGKARPRS